MKQPDQATLLRQKVNNADPVSENEEIDIMNLPSRSEKHSKTKKQQKETIQADRLHIWITRGIVIAFICMILFIVYYFTAEMNLNQNIKNDAERIYDVIK